MARTAVGPSAAPAGNNQTAITITINDASGQPREIALEVKRVLQQELNQTKYALAPRSF